MVLTTNCFQELTYMEYIESSQQIYEVGITILIIIIYDSWMRNKDTKKVK